MPFNKKKNTGTPERDYTKMKIPHTHVITFAATLLCWLLTFLVLAGKFSTHKVEYTDPNGAVKTKIALMADTFRYSYRLDREAMKNNLTAMNGDEALMESLGVDPAGLDTFLETDSSEWIQEDLDELGPTDDVLHGQHGESIYDTSQKLHKTAKVWGTEDFGGFGFLNYAFEGLVTKDRSGSAAGICVLILVVEGSFRIIMKTGAIDAGIYAFIKRTKGLERLALPLLSVLFSLGGATFGTAEECTPLSMIMVPLMIALGYDSIVAITVAYVASQVDNAVSWMSSSSVAAARGIAGIPVLFGVGFRLAMWVAVTLLFVGYMMIYAEKICKNPAHSIAYESDAYFRGRMDSVSEEREFSLGRKLILLETLAVPIWVIWGVTQKGYYIPEIASQFFVTGFAAGVTVVIFKLNDTMVGGMTSAFQSGAADLAGTAIVIGMVKGVLLVLGGSDASVVSTLNTILYAIGNVLVGVPSFIGVLFMYLFQSHFNLIVTPNSGQAALTMSIMVSLVNLVGATRQVAILALQMGTGLVDAFTSVPASLIGVLGVTGIDWGKWAKPQIKMQAFFSLMGTVTIAIATAVNLQ